MGLEHIWILVSMLDLGTNPPQKPREEYVSVCVCNFVIAYYHITHIKMAIQLKVSRISCLYAVQWIVTNLMFVIMKVPQSMENCDSFPLSLCL